MALRMYKDEFRFLLGYSVFVMILGPVNIDTSIFSLVLYQLLSLDIKSYNIPGILSSLT